jgi:hypothetical protein
MIKVIRIICLAILPAILLAQTGLVSANFDTEMDSLSDMFAHGLKPAHQELANDGGPTGQLSADTSMQTIYRNLEKRLAEARQESATQRSALLASVISL